MAGKKIYLTFDDGIQEGTSETVEVLTKLNIKATFFLTGINSYYFYRRNKEQFLETLSTILRDHEAGNHSFSHANGFFREYYSKGLLVNNNGYRISITEDFANNELFFRQVLKKVSITTAPENLFHSARLPGRSSFFFTSPSLNSKLKLFVNCEEDAYNACISLFTKGYNVVGWDDEWHMSYELNEEAVAGCKSRIRSGIKFMESIKQSFPYHNISSDENSMKDRTVEDHEEVFKRIVANPRQEIILLMHDRAFRKSAGVDPANSKLYKLLDMLRQHGCSFETISKFLTHEHEAR